MKKRTYSHLSSEERDKIAYLPARGTRVSDIAKPIGRGKSIISSKSTRKEKKLVPYLAWAHNRRRLCTDEPHIP